MVVNGRPLKRMKRRVTADLNDFLSFPARDVTAGEVTPSGPFRASVKEFLLRHALLPGPSGVLPHLLTWQILFRVGDDDVSGDVASVVLDVVEEDVARSKSVYCDQCRVVGELTRFGFFYFYLFFYFGLQLALAGSLVIN